MHILGNVKIRGKGGGEILIRSTTAFAAGQAKREKKGGSDMRSRRREEGESDWRSEKSNELFLFLPRRFSCSILRFEIIGAIMQSN